MRGSSGGLKVSLQIRKVGFSYGVTTYYPPMNGCTVLGSNKSTSAASATTSTHVNTYSTARSQFN